MIEDFDYENFAKNMAEQAENLAPEDISKEARDYLISTLENFAKLAGESLCKDDSVDLDVHSATVITQGQ